MLLALSGIYFFSFFQRVAIPGTIFNDLQREFSLSAAEVTRLSAIYLFIYAALQPFAGILADRFGGIKIALLSGGLLCAGTVFFALSHNITELYLSRALVGLGAAAIYLCLMKEAACSFSGKNFATIVGIICLIGYGGGLVGTRPFRMMVEWYGWRNSCLLIASFSGVILLFTFFMARKIKREDCIKGNAHILSGIIAVCKQGSNYPILISWSVCFAAYFSVQSIIGAKFLEDLCMITPLQSSNYTFIMMLVTMATLFLSGFVSRFFNNNRKGFLVMASVSASFAMAIFLVGACIKMSALYFLPAYILLAVACGISPVVTALIAENNPPSAVAGAIGLLNTATYVMVAVFAQITGLILDIFKTSSHDVGTSLVYSPQAYIMFFFVMEILTFLAVIFSFCSRETYGQNIYKGPNNITFNKQHLIARTLESERSNVFSAK